MANELTHFDEEGKAIMVDVSGKPLTIREAVAGGKVQMQPETLQQILSQRIKKGDVFTKLNIATKRPGNGISPMQWDEILGTKAKKDFGIDELIEI